MACGLPIGSGPGLGPQFLPESWPCVHDYRHTSDHPDLYLALRPVRGIMQEEEGPDRHSLVRVGADHLSLCLWLGNHHRRLCQDRSAGRGCTNQSDCESDNVRGQGSISVPEILTGLIIRNLRSQSLT